MKKVTAIYVRRSVSDKDKDNNSLSIDSQISECVKSLSEGEEYKLYCDDGKSAKDIERRPAFMQMMSDAKDGLISRIVVKKYDRFSRNMRDYLNITNTLDGYGVGVESLTEKFDTTTSHGRFIRNQLLGFAEFERETIAARVMDAYNTRAAETGFYQGGKVYYGYIPERRTVNGKTGSVLVPSDKADVVKIAYEIYSNPDTSLQDIINYFKDNGIDIIKTKRAVEGKEPKKANMDRSHFSRILESPLYVRADVDVYQYLVSEGYEIMDDIEAFDGIHGLFKHKRSGGKYYLKVGYHEGLVDSETWIAVQDKKSHNQRIPNNNDAKNSWLVGLTKCPHCGYGFYIYYSWNVTKTKQWRYYGDRGTYTAKGCEQNKKRLRIKPDKVEEVVFNAMKNRLDVLEIVKMEKTKPDAETESIKTEIIRIDVEINGLMENASMAKGAMFNLIQERVNSLYDKKSELEERLRSKTRKQKAIDTTPLREPLSVWDTLTVDEKNALAKTMIDVVYVSDMDGINIIFSI